MRRALPDAFLHAHARTVRAICARRLRAHDVDDAVQDVFVRACGSLQRLRDPERLGSYLSRIARNLCVDRLRRPPRRDVSLEELGCEPADGGGTEAGARDLVHDELSRLPAARRELLTWYYLEGRSHDEIAGELGTTRTAVSQRLHRAREELRDAVRGG
jgi:RNA polymerase sigma factor (sigma-70 family)